MKCNKYPVQLKPTVIYSVNPSCFCGVALHERVIAMDGRTCNLKQNVPVSTARNAPIVFFQTVGKKSLSLLHSFAVYFFVLFVCLAFFQFSSFGSKST